MITAIKKGGGEEQMYLCPGPFRWSLGRIEAIRSASPNAACPGLFWKPLDATIRRLLAPYCPSDRQGNSKQNNNVKCTDFAGQVLNRTHCPMKEVQGCHKSH